MSNTSIILSNLDVDTLKSTFKAYLKSQDRFNDYDFEGSNINVLLDLLALNTFHNSFYLNMVGNEMFLDSAQLRDSVVSHAKELNYTPRSFKSATADVDITILTNDMTKRSIVIPKGTAFTSSFGTKNYTFTVGENIVINDFVVNSNNTLTFTGSNISLFEGYYVADSFVFNYASPQRFVISNKNVDISSLAVTVIEDLGATTLSYSRSTSLFDLDSTSKVFFVQGAENDSYEIIFGDGVSGRKPKDNSTIIIEYRISNGELPNGCNLFTADSTIDGETNITVSTNTSASSGAVSESIESIKFNAPRYFTTQERAITTEDYENLLKINFPEVNTVTVFGGEDLDPPQFGKVFVSVDLNDVDGLPSGKKDEYYKFLKPRSPVSIDPVFVDPEYTYLGIKSDVRFNVNLSRLTSNDFKTIVSSTILSFADNNLNDFNKTFRYSKLISAIDNSQIAIISNETEVTVIKRLTPTLGTLLTFDVDYKIPLDVVKSVTTGGYTISSSEFIYAGQKAKIIDDNQGRLKVVSSINEALISYVGSLNYETGLLQFSGIKFDNYSTPYIKMYAVPRNKDISTVNNVILNIVEEDIALNIRPVSA